MASAPLEDLWPFLDREEFLANMLIEPVDLDWPREANVTRIGIMQGRLTPPYEGRFQCFGHRSRAVDSDRGDATPRPAARHAA